MSGPPAELASRVQALLGAAPVSARPAKGGYTHAGRWLLDLADGRRAFAKLATDEDTASWLRAEWRIYRELRAPWLAEVLAWQDGERPLLLLEDLSGAHWPPPWRDGQVEAVRATMAAVAATPPPEWLPRAEEMAGVLQGWEVVAADPAPFLSLGLVDAAWLSRHLDALIALSAAAPIAGESLLHLDLRSDNLCSLGERVVLVDWNWAMRGDARLDLAFWAPSLSAEGGPPPWETLPDEPAYAALVSGVFASCAGRPELPHAPRVREIQRVQLRAALPWVKRALRG